MIRALASVIRGEGWRSAVLRSRERLGEAAEEATLRVVGHCVGVEATSVLNVIAAGDAPRLGGVQQQLLARLDCEAEVRGVALLTPGLLRLSRPRNQLRRVSPDLESGIREALALIGATTVHFEGTAGVPHSLMLRLIESGVDVVVTAHDFALYCARPNLYEEPGKGFCFYSDDDERCLRCLRHSLDVSDDEPRVRRALAREVLSAAKAVVFPSTFLLEKHRSLFSLPGSDWRVIAPAVASRENVEPAPAERNGIAFVGSVKPHKGGFLLPELARRCDVPIHVFGGGDEELFRAIRAVPRLATHGYYAAGTLPSLLSRHRVGLVVIPSVWPETFGLVISEAWHAGAAVVAFDLGAQGERIREQGGGWVAPLESGAAGIAEIVNRWRAGELTTAIPTSIPTPAQAAQSHFELYRTLRLVDGR